MQVKSRHASTGADETIVADSGSFIETNEDASLSTSIAHSPSKNTELVEIGSNGIVDFAAELEKLQMFTSYTGPVPVALEDYYNLEIVITGMIAQTLTSVNEETGEQKTWIEIRMKLEDGKIIAASGQGAKQFASLVLSRLGEGDWGQGVRVLVKVRTLANSGHKMPTFQIIGAA